MSAHVRLVLIFCVGLGAAFALGARATRNVRFPYVSNDLNAPCGKTVFEWNVMAARLDAEPIPLYKIFNLVRMEGDPRPNGLVVHAYVRSKDPSTTPATNTPEWDTLMVRGDLPNGVASIMVRRFGLGSYERAFKQDVFLLIHLDDLPIAIMGNGRRVMIPPEATSAEVSAALAQIMSHAPPP